MKTTNPRDIEYQNKCKMERTEPKIGIVGVFKGVDHTTATKEDEQEYNEKVLKPYVGKRFVIVGDDHSGISPTLSIWECLFTDGKRLSLLNTEIEPLLLVRIKPIKP